MPTRSPVGNMQTASDQSGALVVAQECAAGREAVWMREALHDLAQPLTALECGLFLSTLDPEQDAPKLRQAIEEAMVQCQRMLCVFAPCRRN